VSGAVRNAQRRVLVPLHAPKWGGIHGVQEAIGGALAARGWHLLIALPSSDAESAQRLASAGIDVLPLPLSRFRRSADPRIHIQSLTGLLKDVANLRRIIHERDIGVVQVCGLHNIQGAIAASLNGTPLVWQLLSALVPRPIRTAMMPVIRRTADIVMTNGSGRSVIEAFPGLDRMGDRWIPFRSPVDTRKFAPNDATRAEMRQQLGFGPEVIVIGTVGNRTFQKGHDIFVEAAAIARAHDERLRFCIVGAPVETNAEYYQREVIERAAKLGLLKRPDLTFFDGGNNIARLVTAFDIFTLTSRTEGIPLSLIEAMATGLPTVVPDVGGMAETSPHRQTGLVLENSKAADYAMAWVSLAADDSQRRRYGEAGRLLATSAYSVDAVADAHVAAFEHALLHRSRSQSRGRMQV